MPGKSIYAANQTLEYLLRSGSLYIVLFTTLPDDSGSGGVEVTGRGYSRQPVTFTAAANGQCSNSADLLWAQAIGWGNVVGFGLFDAGGHMLYCDAFPGGPVVISPSDPWPYPFQILAGTLTIIEQ
jgi:hypothetical protein